jgi:carbonic anhydrase/acetyltransferase-like protein (isoleucine patch superfamily)
MLYSRNGETPRVHSTASVAASANIVGNVEIGARAWVDHGVVIESSGTPIEIGEEAIVFAGALLRSIGGQSRLGFPLHVGARTLISPLCVLSGCRVGSNCYVATGAIVLQGAHIGDDVRIGAGAIVHVSTVVPDLQRIGMRHIAVPTQDGFISTPDVEHARQVVGTTDFFETAFGVHGDDQSELHAKALSTLLEEVHSWHDEPQPPG